MQDLTSLQYDWDQKILSTRPFRNIVYGPLIISLARNTLPVFETYKLILLTFKLK